jgi:hypothetical protein
VRRLSSTSSLSPIAWSAAALLVSAAALGSAEVASAEEPSRVQIGPNGVTVQSGKSRVRVAGAEVEAEGDDEDATAPPSAVEATNDDEDDDKRLKVQGVGKKATFACKKDQDVEVQGSGHQLVLTGECRRVTVQGTEHKLTIEHAATILAQGVGHAIGYKRGPSGKEPKIKTQGLDVKVFRLKDK